MNGDNLMQATAGLRTEMREYYRQLRGAQFASYDPMIQVRDKVWAEMDTYAAAHPDAAPWTLKARLHTAIANNFSPVLFSESPFYYEMGLRPAETWGTPAGTASEMAGAWMVARRKADLYAHPAYANVHRFGFGEDGLAIAYDNVFDYDHHAIGTTQLLAVGVNGLLEEISERLQRPVTEGQRSFLTAASESCLAVNRIAERFAERAAACIAALPPDDAGSELRRRRLDLIARTARRVPAEPPRTFYEGLAALWFLREVTATLEGIGISVVGHLDRQLIDLYEADLRAGRLTEAEARDLLARWMLPTDVKFFVDESSWPETSTCIELGGCDAEGVPVYNALTRMIIDVHTELSLLNPKLQCRYSKGSPQEYLDALNGLILDGRNVVSLLNDDVIIPACVWAGKDEREARLYVNGGCQETIVEGVEHSAGAYYYFNMPRVLDLCLLPPPDLPDVPGADEAQAACPQIIDAPDFETFYARFVETLKHTIAVGADWRRDVGSGWAQVNPCPFFSVTLADVIENGQDYTAGGARHNPAGAALVGLATLVDALYAIRTSVYEEGWLSLADLRRALSDNWHGAEALRARLVAQPKFGHGEPAVDALAARIADDIANFVGTLENERGGRFQPSFFVYYVFVAMGERVRATPDGRSAGALLSQGVGPGQLRAPDSITDTFRSLQGLGLDRYPANAVLDVQLPLGSGIPPATLSGLVRGFAALGGATLQPNVVDVIMLQDAQVHPERHRDLTVRICGLSARFVTLTREVQDELIARHVAGV